MNGVDINIQWSQLHSRWECVLCSGISLSRDFDSMGHEVNNGKVTRLRAIYSSAAGEKRNRFSKPNVLYHRTNCKTFRVHNSGMDSGTGNGDF